MTRYYAKKEDRGSRTQVTITLPKVANDYTRSASRLIKEIESSVVSNSEIIEDIIFTQVNSSDTFYQVGKDAYTFKDLLVVDLESRLSQIKCSIVNEKNRIIKELEDIVNQLRASYLISQADLIDTNTREKLNDKLTYYLANYYDKYYEPKDKNKHKEHKELKSDKIISLIDKIRNKDNAEVDKETFINKIMTEIYSNKKHKKLYYEAVLIEEESVLEEYKKRYMEEEEVNDIDKKARKILEGPISSYYESGLSYISSINPNAFLQLSNMISNLIDEIVAEYIVNYGYMPIDMQFRISELLAKRRSSGSKIKSTDYINAGKILEQVVKKYNISEDEMLRNDSLASSSLEYCSEDIIQYIKREIKIEELEKEYELNIIEKKVKLIEIEEQIKERKLELDTIKNKLDIYGK